jgi:hypothetical protein
MMVTRRGKSENFELILEAEWDTFQQLIVLRRSGW